MPWPPPGSATRCTRVTASSPERRRAGAARIALQPAGQRRRQRRGQQPAVGRRRAGHRASLARPLPSGSRQANCARGDHLHAVHRPHRAGAITSADRSLADACAPPPAAAPGRPPPPPPAAGAAPSPPRSRRGRSAAAPPAGARACPTSSAAVGSSSSSSGRAGGQGPRQQHPPALAVGQRGERPVGQRLQIGAGQRRLDRRLLRPATGGRTGCPPSWAKRPWATTSRTGSGASSDECWGT